MATCSICTHERKQEIEAAIAAETSLRDISAEFMVSKSAVARHKKGHASEPAGEATVVQADQARAFLTALTGEPDPVVCFQVFDDSTTKDPKLAKFWHGTLEQSIRALNSRQQQGCGVFVCINQTDGKVRKKDTIQGLRAVFADNDGTLSKPFALPPSFLVQTKRGLCPYWLLKAGEDVHRFPATQARIAAYYSTDPSVKDPSRVMRLPGSWHLKSDPFLVEFIEASGSSYTIDEIVTAHPVPETPKARKTMWNVSSANDGATLQMAMVRHHAARRDWSDGNRHQSALTTAAHARHFGLPDDAVRSVVFQFGGDAGLPDRELDEIVEWTITSVEPNLKEVNQCIPKMTRGPEVIFGSAVQTPEPEPEGEPESPPEELPQEVISELMELATVSSEIIREQRIGDMASALQVAAGVIRSELKRIRAQMVSTDRLLEAAIDLRGLPWFWTEGGIVAAKTLPGGFLKPDEDAIAATRPIWPESTGRDVTTGAPWVELAWVDSHVQRRSRWIKQEDLRNKDLLKALPGACIGGSTRQNRLADYLADSEPRAPRKNVSVSGHIGWAAGRWLWPGNENGIILMGDPLPPPGDIARWRRGVDHLVSLGEGGYPALLCLCLSVASPLVRLVGRRNPVMVLSAQTSSGKGTSIDYALSVWTDPRTLTIPANSTIKGTQDVGLRFPDVALFVDEIHMLIDPSHVLYFLANGQRRMTSSKAQVAVGGERRWGAGFAAGEVSMTSGRHGGVAARVIEMDATPLPDRASARTLREATFAHGALAPLLAVQLQDAGPLLAETWRLADQLEHAEGLIGDDTTAIAITAEGGYMLARALALSQDWIVPAVRWLIKNHVANRQSTPTLVEHVRDRVIDLVMGGNRVKDQAAQSDCDTSFWINDLVVGWLSRDGTTLDVQIEHPSVAGMLREYGGWKTLAKPWANRGFIQVARDGHHMKVNRRDVGRVVRFVLPGEI